ncbi:MAG: Rrf2 family transcriptional regulator [Clostridiales bacterium]|uniref:RrF2 family transcriptional regulator n=1 Tax=Chordicoccus furentiruminis TaxID=2709410 RepID=UPI0023A7E3B7|nr:Rrf2 family transcriptional regulator [Chordicoccus furentiruminis]MCI6174709.1 Rrf2 family transcriptional regulator [Clostridiales bacterium]
MKVSTKGRYALRIMLDLAFHNSGGLVPLKDIAKRQDITLKYMEQIISPLSKAGFVISLRGSSGGYRLARKPSQYTCGDILRVVEGPLVPTVCLENGVTVDCPRADECPTISFWKGLSDVINQYVDSVTLEDLMNRQLAAADDYVI